MPYQPGTIINKPDNSANLLATFAPEVLPSRPVDTGRRPPARR
ncbi:MAG: hypothetical protein WBO35_05510 [Candidatus Saccharimonadales bacterium]